MTFSKKDILCMQKLITIEALILTVAEDMRTISKEEKRNSFKPMEDWLYKQFECFYKINEKARADLGKYANGSKLYDEMIDKTMIFLDVVYPKKEKG